jgi:hypothetical protein
MGFFPENNWRQLTGAPTEAGDLAQGIFSVVAANFDIGKAFLISQFANLEGVARCDQNVMSARF